MEARSSISMPSTPKRLDLLVHVLCRVSADVQPEGTFSKARTSVFLYLLYARVLSLLCFCQFKRVPREMDRPFRLLSRLNSFVVHHF